jgi:hypothetical protein
MSSIVSRKLNHSPARSETAEAWLACKPSPPLQLCHAELRGCVRAFSMQKGAIGKLANDHAFQIF